MKNIKLLFILVCFSIVATKCSREEFGTPPPATEVLSTLTGNWTLRKVTQKDEGAEIKNSPYVSMDITSLFPYTQYKLVITGTATAANGTFTATPGSSPRILAANTGTWEVDDIKNPKIITFINGAARTQMQISSYPTSFSNSFKLRQTKVDAATNKAAITYDYEFVKQ